MKTHIIAGIACAAVVATAIGCDNNEGMGYELLPAADKANVTVETIEVKAYTELESPIVSSNTSYMMLGAFQDNIFGLTETSFACKFSNSSYGKYTSGDICDSVRLSLGVDKSADFVYGDKTQAVTIEAYRVTTPLTQETYYSDFDMTGKYDTEKIGGATFVPANLDTALSFMLDKSFGQKVIDNSLASTFDDNICGLYFKVSASESGNCIVKFFRMSDYTQYEVFCHNETGKTSVKYSIQSTDCNFNLIAHKYDSDLVDVVKSNANGIQTPYLYLQSMVGTRIRLDISGLDKLKRNSKYFAVCNAYLEAPLADSAYSNQKEFPAIDNVVCVGMEKKMTPSAASDTIKWYFDNITDSYRRTNDSTLYFNDFVLNMEGAPTMNVLSRDMVNNCYRINMTGRINNLLQYKDRGEEPSYNIYMYPNARTTDFNRSLICSPVNTQTPMKLVVEYVNYEI